MSKIALKIKGEIKTFHIDNEPLVFGRVSKCPVHIKDSKISRQHCHITKTSQGGFKITDLDSANSTFVNGERISDKILFPKDVIKIGNSKIVFDMVEETQIIAPLTERITLEVTSKSGVPEKKRTFELEQDLLIIGRGKDCSLRIRDKKTSRKHCQITKVSTGQYKVTDLNSANGTLINGHKISEHTLKSGDIIRIGAHKIVFSLSGDAPATPQADKVGPAKKQGTRICDGLTISRFLDHAVTEAEYEKINAHLETCSDCQKKLSDLDATDGLIKKTLSNLKLDLLLVTNILDKLPTQEHAPLHLLKKQPHLRKASHIERFKRSPSLIPTIAIAAGVLIASLILIKVYVEKQSQPRPSIITQPPDTARRSVDQQREDEIAQAIAKLKRDLAAAERKNREVTTKHSSKEEIAAAFKEVERLKAEEARREAEFAALRAKHERWRKEEEEAKRRAEEERQRLAQQRQQLALYQQKLNQTKHQYAKSIREYKFSTAVSLSENLLKQIPKNISYLKTIEKQATVWLEEAQQQNRVFKLLIEGLAQTDGKRIIETASKTRLVIEKVDENGIKGYDEKHRKSKYQLPWNGFSATSIYETFDIWELADRDKFNLAIFCYTHNLIAEAEKLLKIYHRRQPTDLARINELLARIRNIPLPPGGFLVYGNQWITAEEKSYIDQGLIKYKGKWMAYDETMIAKGYVQYKGRWRKKAEVERIEATARRLAELKRQLAQAPPQGVIDRAGADKEKLPWSEAREKKTDHYIIRTNLSDKALLDTACVMESAYLNFVKLFDTRERKEKLLVEVFRTQGEYFDIGNAPGGSGGYYTAGTLKTFYQVACTTSVLLHEGTHQFVDMVCNTRPPIWINEGLATYYGGWKFKERDLVKQVDHNRLNMLRRMIHKNTYMRLADFINLTQPDYKPPQYTQGWSLVYFLIHSKDGRYEQGFRDYFDYVKKHAVDTTTKGNREKHITLFEEKIDASIDQLEKEWKAYILKKVR
ncbi:FHA domain-containing protein [Planctomycetota bacterium]